MLENALVIDEMILEVSIPDDDMERAITFDVNWG
jgi:hypothetical protein